MEYLLAALPLFAIGFGLLRNKEGQIDFEKFDNDPLLQRVA